MSTTWDATAQSTGVYIHIFTKHRSRPAVFDMVSAPESQYTRRNNSINNRATLWQTVLRHIHRHNSGGRTTLYARRACIYLLVCWYPGRASERATSICVSRAPRVLEWEREATMLHTGSSPPHTMGCAMYERVNRYSRTLYPAINYVIDLLLTNINFVCVCERAFRERR